MTFEDAFEDLIKDLSNAEKQLTKALPKMAKAASNDDLRAGFEDHLKQTEEHVQRLEQVAEKCGFKTSGKVCHAMQGLVEEGSEAIKEFDKGPVLDAMLIAAAQKVEHYEIASYGTACAWAKMLGEDDAAELLTQTLEEESQTDEKLNQLAEGGINQEACDAPEMDGKARRKSTTSTARKTSTASKSSSSSRSKAGAAK